MPPCPCTRTRVRHACVHGHVSGTHAYTDTCRHACVHKTRVRHACVHRVTCRHVPVSVYASVHVSGTHAYTVSRRHACVHSVHGGTHAYTGTEARMRTQCRRHACVHVSRRHACVPPCPCTHACLRRHACVPRDTEARMRAT